MRSRSIIFDDRREMPGREFVDSLPIAEEHHDLAETVRRAIAAACGLDPAFLYPTDPTRAIAEQIVKRHGQDWDEILILFALEEEFGDDLPATIVEEWPAFLPWRLLWWRGGSDTFGDWLELIVQAIARKTGRVG